MQTVTIVCTPDIFRPETRIKKQVAYVKDKTIKDYLLDESITDDISCTVAVNGIVVDSDLMLQPSDIVSVRVNPQGGAFSHIVFLLTRPFTLIGFFANYVKDVLSADVADRGDYDTSPTYGWGDLRQSETEGNPIPICFGTSRIGGQIINQFTKIGDDNKEYLALLLAVNDGEVTEISDITINDQSAEKYKGVDTYTRLGTATDTVIPEFNEIVQQHSLSYIFDHTNDDATVETDGNSVEKITVQLVAPQGLYYITNSGALEAAGVNLLIEYRIAAGSWLSYGAVRMSGATIEPVRKSIVIDDLTAAKYEIKVTQTSAGASEQGSPQRFSLKIEWVGLKEAVKEALIYPGVAKYAMLALATDQLSGGKPKVTAIVNRSTVSVYNPNAGWGDESASNPAWAAYAFLNTHHNVPAAQILYDEFSDWADFCDEVVEGEARFEIGIVFDTHSNAWANLQKIAKLGRAAVVRKNAKYGVFIDRADSTVSHLFTMGNIVAETFKLTYLPKKDRANAIEITYIDPDREYSNQVVAIYSDDFKSSSTAAIKESVRVDAAITRTRAIRKAAIRLNINKKLLRQVEFEAGVDSFAAEAGDIVYFQHDVPNYDIVFGNRIIAAGNDDGSGNAYVQLDQEVELTVSTSYSVLVKLSDDTIVEKALQAIGSTHTTDTLLLTTSWAIVPEQYDLYVFGLTTSYKKLYRIIDIGRSQTQIRRLSLLEYDATVYDDTGYTIEDDPSNSPDDIDQAAVNVQAREFLIYSNSGSYLPGIAVSWQATADDVGSMWDVWLEDETLSRTFQDTEDTVFESTDSEGFIDANNTPGFQLVASSIDTKQIIGSEYLTVGHEFTIYICPHDEGLYPTDYNWASIKIEGKYRAPEDVVTFSAGWDTMKRTVNFSWSEVTDIDLDSYEIREGATWDGGTVVVDGAKGSSASLPIEEGVIETRTYWIKAVDTSGIYSATATDSAVAIDTTGTALVDPSGLALSTTSDIAPDGTDRVMIIASWNNNAETAQWHHYELRLTNISTSKITDLITTDVTCQWEVIPGVQYGVKIRAVDFSGNKTDWSSQVLITAGKDSTAPAFPTSVTLTEFFSLLKIQWSHGGEDDLSHFDIYRNTTNTTAGADKIGSSVKDSTGSTSTYKDVPPSYNTYYYWVKAVDYSGNASGYSTVVAGSLNYVDTVNIETDAITATEISDDAIETPHLSANSVTTAKINTNAVTANEISSGAVTTLKLNAAAVTADKIDALAVTTGKLAADAVTASKINVSTLSAITANLGTIVAGILQSDNYSAAAGSYFNLNTEVIKIGGSSSPKISYDGTTVTINGDIIVSGTVVTAALANNAVSVIENAASSSDVTGGAVIYSDVVSVTLNPGGNYNVLLFASPNVNVADGDTGHLRIKRVRSGAINYNVAWTNLNRSDAGSLRWNCAITGIDTLTSSDTNNVYTLQCKKCTVYSGVQLIAIAIKK